LVAYQAIGAAQISIGESPSLNPHDPIIGKVTPEPHLWPPVRFIDLVRYGTVSVCYLALIIAAALTTIATVAVVIMENPPRFLSKHIVERLPTVVGLITASGGLGFFLLRADYNERKEMRSRELLESLPPSKELIPPAGGG
jgi:hypothetical protein